MTAKGLTNAIQKIGRYRVTGELGRGGMGVVYQGEDRLIGRRVAIKTLTEVTPELRERFYIEARSGILSHPNIVTVYELGEHDGNPFIAMEFIDGESLEQVLHLRERLPLLEALSIVEQLCAGLGYAHGHGVVHRDVKPANVLVRPDGRVTIVDFGIARLADQTRQLTKPDALLGTFHYIAPERLKGEASDGRSDIWSVGVMLYEMLTGNLPFKGNDVSSLYRVLHEPYVPLSEHVQEDLPGGLSRVLDKALAKEVDLRYATAEEMAFDLHLLAQGPKHDRVDALLETAQRLMEEGQYASARTVLLQAQRIDPTNIDTKALSGEVQDHLSHMQRGDQLRQIVDQAQDAANGRRWNDAVLLFQQALKLDPENAFDLDERLQEAQRRKVQQQRVLELWKRADEARNLGNLTKAQDYLGQALQIDNRSTELRNAYSDLLREVKIKEQQLRVEELLRSARRESSGLRYTEAISRLREAAEIDPAHAEVQEILLLVTARQKEERQQQVLDHASSDIRESLDRDDFSSADDHVTRALETLPSDGLLLQLKSEIEGKKRDVDVHQAVRNPILEAQELFAEQPEQALRLIEEELKEAPDSDTLLQSRARVLEYLKELEKRSARAQPLEDAPAGQYPEAQRVPGATTLLRGPIKDLQQQLSQGNAEKKRDAAPAEAHELHTALFPRVIDPPAPLKSANGDPEVTVLADETQRKQDEAEGQCDLTTQFTQILLKAQAGEIPSSQHKQSREVRAKEDDEAGPEPEPRRAAEIRIAVEKAVVACDRAIAAGKLDHCMRPLNDLAKQYGEGVALATAREACALKRDQKATQVLREAVHAAQRELRNSSPISAEGALKKAESALPFAVADVRSEWQRLQGECAAVLGAKQQTPKSVRPAKRSKARWYVAGSTAAVVALAVVRLLHLQHDATALQEVRAVHAPAHAVVPTGLEINASPWARVVGLHDRAGKPIALPDGDHTTPLRLEGLSSGTYHVTLAGADGKQQTVECNVSSGEHLCTANMSLPGIEQVLMGGQP
jgi:serine/threonine-protein kinase